MAQIWMSDFVFWCRQLLKRRFHISVQETVANDRAKRPKAPCQVSALHLVLRSIGRSHFMTVYHCSRRSRRRASSSTQKVLQAAQHSGGTVRPRISSRSKPVQRVIRERLAPCGVFVISDAEDIAVGRAAACDSIPGISFCRAHDEAT
jgi:hypothetical protein